MCCVTGYSLMPPHRKTLNCNTTDRIDMVRETITERISPDGNKIIEHHIEDVILYPGSLGKKCDYCNCYFANNYDEWLHLEAFGRRPHGKGVELDPNSLDGLDWKKSDFDEG